MTIQTDHEATVLGTILQQGSLIWEAIGRLPSPQDFSRQQNRLIYEAMLALASAGTAIDLISVRDQMRRSGTLKELDGGDALLVTLSRTVASSSETFLYAARLVKERSICRQLATYGKLVAARCEHPSADGFEEMDRADEELQRLHTEMLRPKSPSVAVLSHQLSNAIQERYAKYQQMLATGSPVQLASMTGVTTGLDRLDRLLGGLQKGDLVLYAGATSMGKSALALTTAYHIARSGGRVLYISLEMSAESLLLRLASMHSGIPLYDLRFGRLDPAGWAAARETMEAIGTLPIAIEDASTMTLLDIRSRARAEQRRHGVDIIIVDYLQFISGPKSERKDLEVGAISRGLKALAKEINVPVVALSQLSRLSSRMDKRPMLTDLRESGSLEQDSDAVIFVYRPEYYHETTHEINGTVYGVDGLAEIIVAKHRQGETGSFPATFLKTRTMFANHIVRDSDPAVESFPAIVEKPF